MKHIKQINIKLLEIHNYIISYEYNSHFDGNIAKYVEAEEYLCKTKKSIEEIPNYPLVFKAIFTSLMPFIPTLVKIAASAFECLFQN